MRSNRRKDLILDFTSLLDVVMLLLFFFILFSRIEVDDAKADAAVKVQQEQEAAQRQIEEARKSKARYDNLYQENVELQNKFRQELETLDKYNADTVHEVINFSKGMNLKLVLEPKDDNPEKLVLRIVLKKDKIEEYSPEDFTIEDLIQNLEEYKISADKTVMCEFIYDGEQSYTYRTYNRIRQILNELQTEKGYKHFYYSETDLSIGRER